MGTVHQLPDNIGQKSVVRQGVEVQAPSEFPAGQTTGSGSVPTVLPRSGYILPIIDNYRNTTEVDRDMLGFPRTTTPFSFLQVKDTYSLDSEDWITDVTGLNERPQLDGTESARWTQLSKATAVYQPAPNGDIKHNITSSSAQLFLNTNKGGFQRVRVCTKKRYRYQPGRIVRTTLALRLSTQATPVNVTRLWGIGDTNDGFFVEASGDGEGDRLQILYRNSSGNGLRFETRIPRSEWNGDHLDGTGPSNVVLDLSKVHMWMVEWGWYGASDVRFYAYLVDEADDLPATINRTPRSRWILAHELLIADTATRSDLEEPNGAVGNDFGLRSYDVPSLRSPSIPLWVEISNSGTINRSEFIERYGASIEVDGGTADRAKISPIDSSDAKIVHPYIGGQFNGKGLGILTLRSKELLINDSGKEVENFLVTNPMTLNVASTQLIEIEVWRDPEMVSPIGVGHLNGELPHRPGDYVSPFNLIPVKLVSFYRDSDDDPLTLFELSLEVPSNQQDTVKGDSIIFPANFDGSSYMTVDASFNDYRIVKSGQKLGSFMVSPKGATIDLTDIFNVHRSNLTTEYDTPTEFPTATSTILVSAYNENTGVISVDSAFPLLLYKDQRLTYKNKSYYVLSIDSSTTFRVKEAKVDTNPAKPFTRVAGQQGDPGVGESFIAYYELDLKEAVASSLKPIYRTEIVFTAKPLNAAYSNFKSSEEYNAQWLTLSNATSSDFYQAQQAPIVNLFITNGVI